MASLNYAAMAEEGVRIIVSGAVSWPDRISNFTAEIEAGDYYTAG